jgi:hypothetical protein
MRRIEAGEHRRTELASDRRKRSRREVTTSRSPTAASSAVAERIADAKGRAVLLDVDLAAIYGVETRAWNQAVKRNAERFPEDFAFRLTLEEVRELRSLRSRTVI